MNKKKVVLHICTIRNAKENDTMTKDNYKYWCISMIMIPQDMITMRSALTFQVVVYNSLLKNIHSNSAVIMDIAPDHSILDKAQTTRSRKADMLIWSNNRTRHEESWAIGLLWPCINSEHHFLKWWTGQESWSSGSETTLHSHMDSIMLIWTLLRVLGHSLRTTLVETTRNF